MLPVDPNTHGMKWMKERQCFYRDIQLEFWLLLRPLTDGSEERTRQLALQTTVCMALVFGGGPSHIAPHAYIHEHWILAAPN